MTALVAAGTAVAIIAGSVTTWAVIRVADPGDGTVAHLEQASNGGAWQALVPEDILLESAAEPGEPLELELDRDSESWVLQVTVTAADEPVAVTTADSTIAFLVAAPGQTVSATTLIRSSLQGTASLSVTAPAVMSVQAIARFTPPDDDGSLGPGGSVAIAPETIVDTSSGIGPPADVDGELLVSVLGLGDVPSTSVLAVWLNVVLAGEDSAVDVPSGAEWVTALSGAAGGAAQGLILAPVDEEGRVSLRLSGGAAESRISIVGWVAGPSPRVSASLIDGGVVAGAVSDVSFGDALPAVVPRGAVALWMVTSSGGEGRFGSLVDDGASTTTLVRGDASALVASTADLSIEGDRELESVAFLGFVNDAGDDNAPLVAIESPTSGEVIDLAERSGVVTFSGTVDGRGAGIARVDLRVGGRYVGTAPVRLDGALLRWTLTTSAPPGAHDVTAVATTVGGVEASDIVSVSFDFPVASDQPIVRSEVVVFGDDDAPALVDLEPDRVVIDDLVTVAVGDIVVAGASEAAPEGFLRRVLAVEVRDGRTELRTVPAGLDEVFLSAEVSIVDAPVDPATQGVGDAASQSEPPLDTTASGPDEGLAGPPAFAFATSAVPVSTAPVEDALGPPIVPAASPAETLAGSLGSWELRAQLTFENELDDAGEIEKTSLSLDVSSVVNDLLETSIVDSTVDEVQETDGAVDDGIGRTVGASVTVSRKLAMFYTFILDVDVELRWLVPEVTVSRFETSTRLETTDTTDLAAYGTVSYSSADDPAIGQLPEIPIGGPVTFTIGPVPVVLTFAIAPEIEVSLSVSARTTMRIQSSESVTVGVRVVDGVVSPIAERSDTRTPVEPTTVITATAGLEVGLGLKIKAYETLSVTIGVAKGIELTAEVLVADAARASLSLIGYLDLTFSAGLSIFGIRVAEWSASQRVYEDEIWSTEVGSGPTDDVIGPSGPTDLARGDGDRLLVLVVDVSGSMGGERIDEAKASLNRVVQTQQSGAELGIWTYPGDSGCGAGRFTVPPAARTATGELLDIIDGLATGGQTPTGEALREVADRLVAEGRSGATILLISDGESNCGPPPCDVADEIRSQGFDLTVQSVGFQISDAGRDELECIAQVTEGQSYDVQEAEELWPLIESLSLAELTVDATAPSEMRSGSSAWITVTVSNPSARDITRASAIVNAVSPTVSVSVSPTTVIELGNIPAGGEVTRRLALSTDPSSPDAVGAIDLEISAWADNASLVTSTVRTVAAVDPVIEPGPALDDREVVSVGDGFAPWAMDDARQGCDPTDQEGAFVVSCPGARSSDILDTVQPDRGGGGARAESQLAAIGDRGVDTVVVVVGAEDVGLGTLLEACRTRECTFDDPSVQAALVATQLIDLSYVYERIDDEAGAEGAAEVVVGAYPQLFPPSSPSCGEFSAAEAQVFSTLIALLNASIQESVDRARERGATVSYLPGSADALRPDLTFCSDAPGVETVDAGIVALTGTGARALTDSVLAGSAALPPVADAPATAEAAPTGRDTRGVLDALLTPEIVVRVNANAITADPLGTVLKPWQPVVVVGEGYQPGSLVVATLTRDATQPLAVGLAADDGSIELRGTVPGAMAPGQVSVTVYGADSEGALTEGAAAAMVAASVPDWLALIGLTAVLGLLVSLVLILGPLVTGRRTATRARS